MAGLTREDLLRSVAALLAQGAIVPGAALPAGTLRAYYCAGTNRRTGHPCRTVLLEAWSPAGAVVRRRCRQCGAWQTIYVRGEDTRGSDPPSSVLD
jgi:hypothetical protein